MTLRAAFTVDLEQDAPPFLNTSRGAEHGMPELLSLLADADVVATVFCTGDVARRYQGLARLPASMTSSVLRLPRLLRNAVLVPLPSPLVLFVHPWELVDLRRTNIRWDCRAGTGEHAARGIASTLRDLSARGATFHTVSALVEIGRREDAGDPAHEGERNAMHG